MDQDELIKRIFESLDAYESRYANFSNTSISKIAGGGVQGAPPVPMFTLYQYRKATEHCSDTCAKNMACKTACYIKAARRVLRMINAGVSGCVATDNSKKCRQKLRKEGLKWMQRLHQLEIRATKYQTKQAQKIAKQRRKRFELNKRK